MSRTIERQMKRYMNRRLQQSGEDIRAIEEAYRDEIRGTVIPCIQGLKKGFSARSWEAIEDELNTLSTLFENYLDNPTVSEDIDAPIVSKAKGEESNGKSVEKAASTSYGSEEQSNVG